MYMYSSRQDIHCERSLMQVLSLLLLHIIQQIKKSILISIFPFSFYLIQCSRLKEAFSQIVQQGSMSSAPAGNAGGADSGGGGSGRYNYFLNPQFHVHASIHMNRQIDTYMINSHMHIKVHIQKQQIHVLECVQKVRSEFDIVLFVGYSRRSSMRENDGSKAYIYIISLYIYNIFDFPI